MGWFALLGLVPPFLGNPGCATARPSRFAVSDEAQGLGHSPNRRRSYYNTEQVVNVVALANISF